MILHLYISTLFYTKAYVVWVGEYMAGFQNCGSQTEQYGNVCTIILIYCSLLV